MKNLHHLYGLTLKTSLMLVTLSPPCIADDNITSADLNLTADILTLSVILALHLVFYFSLFVLAAFLGNYHRQRSNYWAKESNFDSLTGLLNRRGLQQTLSQNTTRFEHGGFLLLIDIDNFKQINDSFGHDQGDSVLKQVGAILQDTTRNDDIVCRLGGEEFLILTETTSLAHAKEQALRIIRAIPQKTAIESVQKEQTSHSVTVSIGVARFDKILDWEKDSYQQADTALYQAKRSGKNTVCFADVSQNVLG